MSTKLPALLGAALLLLSTVLASAAHAADREGNFAVKGAGVARCSDFLAARRDGGQEYFMYAGWAEGYLSAANRYEDDTFDLAPWQSTDVLVTVLAGLCERAPEETFHSAVNGMLRLFQPSRLTERSPMLALESDGAGVALYAEVLQRVRARLAERGHLTGAVPQEAPSGTALDGPTAAALASYQEARGIPVTRLPNPMTLLHLFTDLGDTPVD